MICQRVKQRPPEAIFLVENNYECSGHLGMLISNCFISFCFKALYSASLLSIIILDKKILFSWCSVKALGINPLTLTLEASFRLKIPCSKDDSHVLSDSGMPVLSFLFRDGGSQSRRLSEYRCYAPMVLNYPRTQVWSSICCLGIPVMKVIIDRLILAHSCNMKVGQ